MEEGPPAKHRQGHAFRVPSHQIKTCTSQPPIFPQRAVRPRVHSSRTTQVRHSPMAAPGRCLPAKGEQLIHTFRGLRYGTGARLGVPNGPKTRFDNLVQNPLRSEESCKPAALIVLLSTCFVQLLRQTLRVGDCYVLPGVYIDMPGSISAGAGSETPPSKRVRRQGEEQGGSSGVSPATAASTPTSSGDSMER